MVSSPKSEARGKWFRQVLHQLMYDQKVSVARLAQLCDMDEHTVDDVLKGRHSPSIYTAERMVNALGHDFEVMPRNS